MASFTCNLTGLWVGLTCMVCIGAGFVWVIRLEYHLGAEMWKPVLSVGLLFILTSLFMPDFWTSALLGIIGGTLIWGAGELPDQEKRAQAGLFPIKPGREVKRRDD